MSSVAAEDLIARLSGGLNPADRAAFRRVAENALATEPECSGGEGVLYRTITKLWRGFFRPPSDTRPPSWYETPRKREVPRFVASSKAHHQPAHKAPCRVSGKS